jgi:hypothetical protein
MTCTDFNRANYFSQSELVILHKGKLSISMIKELIVAHQITVYTRPVEIGYGHGNNFNVEARYILKEDWHKVVD